MTTPTYTPSRRPGLTPAGLAVVLATVGALAGGGAPFLIRSAERARVSEAFDYLSSVRSAQERYQARFNTYASQLSDLDVDTPPPSYFSVEETFRPGVTSSLRDSWTIRLKRSRVACHHGDYTLVFREIGFDAAASTIDRSLVDGLAPAGPR